MITRDELAQLLWETGEQARCDATGVRNPIPWETVMLDAPVSYAQADAAMVALAHTEADCTKVFNLGALRRLREPASVDTVESLKARRAELLGDDGLP